MHMFLLLLNLDLVFVAPTLRAHHAPQVVEVARGAALGLVMLVSVLAGSRVPITCVVLVQERSYLVFVVKR